MHPSLSVPVQLADVRGRKAVGDNGLREAHAVGKVAVHRADAQVEASAVADAHIGQLLKVDELELVRHFLLGEHLHDGEVGADRRVEGTRVLFLMVFRHERRGHEQRRTAEHAQLAEGRGARAANDEVSRRHAVRHVVDILGVLDVRVVFEVRALLTRHFRQPVACRRAGRVNVVILDAVFALKRKRSRHVLVHILRAHRAPDGHNELVVFAETELRARLFAARCKDFPAHRSAGQDDLFAAAEQLFRLLEADQHAVGLFREHLRDLAGEGVDLKQHGRVVKLLRRLDHREGGIAAAADHAVRTRLAQHLFRLCDGGNRELRRLEVVHDALRAHRARQADDLDRVERIALTRHQLVLDAACRTGKAHDRIRLTLLKISCNGKTGRYVAARSSAGNIKSHRMFPLPPAAQAKYMII